MYKTEDIRYLHIEITSKCNAHCPMCLRNVMGGKINPQLPITDLGLNDFQSMLTPQFIQQLKRIYFCGNYGDPLAAEELLDVIGWLRHVSTNLKIEVFTNGSLRSSSWWKQLAITGTIVRFAIDGLEDTNHIYRRGTSFKKIIENATSFINAGGIAQWDYIVFKHNEHQIENAQKLSEGLGFKQFQIKKSGRFFSNSKSIGKDSQPVHHPQTNMVQYEIEKPSRPQYINDALKKEQMLIKKYHSLERYLDQTPIQCKVAIEKSLYLSAEGLIFPCCWTANQLYPWYYKPQTSHIWSLINQLPNGKSDLCALNNSIEEIVSGPFFQEILPKAWQLHSIKQGRPKYCAKTCGSEFDPFKAQFNQA